MRSNIYFKQDLSISSAVLLDIILSLLMITNRLFILIVEELLLELLWAVIFLSLHVCVAILCLALKIFLTLLLVKYRRLDHTSVLVYICHCILALAIISFLSLFVNVLLRSFKYIKVLFSTEHIFFLCVINCFPVICFLTLNPDLFDSVLVSLTAPPITLSNYVCLAKVIIVFLYFYLALPLSHSSFIDMSLFGDISFKRIVDAVLVFHLFLEILALHILTAISIVRICWSLVPEILLGVVAAGGVMSEHFMGNVVLPQDNRLQRFPSEHLGTISIFV